MHEYNRHKKAEILSYLGLCITSRYVRALTRFLKLGRHGRTSLARELEAN